MATQSPTLKRRQLSATLRQLREENGLTSTEAAKRLEWAPSKLTRIERNEWKLPNVHDVRLLLDLYGVTDRHQRESLLTLARESRQRGWWAEYKDVFRSNLPAFEVGASLIRTYEVVLIPGLLQTPAYTAAVFRGGQVLDEVVVNRHVEARIARQKILSREQPPSLVAIIDEAALLKAIGGREVMHAQLRHLIEMASRPNITIQVIPNAVGAHPALTGGPFVILDFPSDRSLVYMATATDSLWLDRPEEYQRYSLIFTHVSTSALSAEESTQLIAAIMDQHKR
ncbi:transcriptional regulator [Sphaerisporangium melleum]|uniref:Transcriptional regulator n=1 Tax=Sphaerisporangium melleum TaxID=321316 RepID=A0A917VEG4_9ACTN|nr:helix-turn-helix transcriptional regulator [Sphaerisporangium melleum]GGK69049.1 transcriptional regulator [Sphaerisporangium melleum]GII68965.1 transcriptional regulator [Sphaerisporangium melleum]